MGAYSYTEKSRQSHYGKGDLMKFILSLITGFTAALLLVAAIGYFGLPHISKAITAGISAEVKALDERLQKAEAFIKQEEELRNKSQLSKDANFSQIVDKINVMATQLALLEEAVRKKESFFAEEIAKAEDNSRKASEKLREELADLTKNIEKEGKEVERLNQKIILERNILLVRSHILKARMELSLKNIDTAKKELDFASDLFLKAGIDKMPPWKESFEDIQAGFRKAKGEIDLNLPAAIQRIDVLWHDMDRLSKP
jgi:uncharacterized protein YdhG (YjbR/CyaY superfamily)